MSADASDIGDMARKGDKDDGDGKGPPSTRDEDSSRKRSSGGASSSGGTSAAEYKELHGKFLSLERELDEFIVDLGA